MASEAYLGLSATHILHLLIIVKKKMKKGKQKGGKCVALKSIILSPLFFKKILKKGKQKGGKYDEFERSNLSATHFLHLSIIAGKNTLEKGKERKEKRKKEPRTMEHADQRRVGEKKKQGKKK